MPKFLILSLLLTFSLPGFCLEEDEAAVLELEKVKIEQARKARLVEQSAEVMAKPVLNPLAGMQDVDMNNLMDPKTQAVVQNILRSGFMSKLPPEGLKKMIAEKTEGTFIGSVLKKFPVLTDIFVDIVRDKEASASLLGILIRKDDLLVYTYIWIALVVFGIFFKKWYIRPINKLWKRMLASFSYSIFSSALSIYIFYVLFSQELDPTLIIIKKYI